MSDSVRPHRRQPTRNPIAGILQAKTLEWVAISFSSAWKWKVKGKSLSRVQLFMTPWTVAYQAPPSMGFSRQEYWSGVPLPSPYSMCTWRCILLHLDGMSWRYQRDPSHLLYHLTCVSLLIFCFDDLSIGVSGVLKSPTITVLLSVSPFMSISVCLGEGNGTPLQYFCLENPMDGGAWWAAVHGVARVGNNRATSLSLFTCMHWRRKWQPTPVFLPGESQGREAWWAAVYGVAQSQTRLKRRSSSVCLMYCCFYVQIHF